MNRYPLWKYAILVIALIVGIVYTLPNLFGEAPAVQVSSGKVTVKLDASMRQRVEDILAKASLQPDFVQYDGNSVKARFAEQIRQRVDDADEHRDHEDRVLPERIAVHGAGPRTPGVT